MSEEYAGWANWETWVTNLWASQHEPFYKQVVALTRAGKVEEAIDRTINYAASHERKLDTTKINRQELKEAFLEMSGIEAGQIKVIETGDVDWFKPGIHLRNPSPKEIEDAKEDAINKGFDTVYVHLVDKFKAPEASAPGEGRKYLTGRRWELIGYSWRQNIVTDKWDAMRVFGDGSSDPAEMESYETRDEAHTAAEKLAMKKNVPVFPPERNHAVFYTAD